MSNMIGIASNDASVLAGVRGGLTVLVRKNIPWPQFFDFICHSFALCGVVTFYKLNSDIVKFAQYIYNFIALFPKRKEEFEQCQDFVRTEKHKILYPSRTRMLVLEKVAKRLLEQWNALSVDFAVFLSQERTDKAKIGSMNSTFWI